MALTIESAAFQLNGNIPRKHTCEGADVSPPLAWRGEPGATKSFALIVDDPDAPDIRRVGSLKATSRQYRTCPRPGRCKG